MATRSGNSLVNDLRSELNKAAKENVAYDLHGDNPTDVKTWIPTGSTLLDYLISISTIKSELTVELDQTRLRPIDADLQVPNTSKFEKHTGWQVEIPFEETMLDLLNYWRDKVKNEGNNFLAR